MYVAVNAYKLLKCYHGVTKKVLPMPTLSDRKIRDTKPGATDKWISDGAGLNIRIRPNGTKTWVIRRKQNGKTTTETLGEFPTMNCAAARTAFAKKSFAPDLTKITFGDLLDEWYSRRIEPRYRTTKNIVVYVARGKEKFGSVPIQKLTTANLVKALQEYAEDAPVAANRCQSNWKQALNYATECGYIERNPLTAVTNRVVGGEEKTRDRKLSDDEIRAMWKWNHKQLRFLLLTGLRISESMEGRADGDVFRVEQTKNGDPHWVHMPSFTLEQLDEFKITTTGVQNWVKRHCAKDGITPFTPHDLRRTFATRLAGLGIPPHVVEKCLNHRMQGVMGIYNRHEYAEERIDAAKRWADELRRIVSATA